MVEMTLSPAGRRYGRDIPPPLPPHRMLTRGLPPGAPLFKDFRTAEQGGTNPATAFCGPVKDQGQEGSCTGHEKASNGEWIARAYSKLQTLFSPQYIYEKELIEDGDFPNDVGSNGETGCLVVIKYGLCEASEDPYLAGRIEAPTAAQDANAAQYRMGAYHGISDSTTAISCLSDPVPWPVGIGFEVYDYFESNEMAKTGILYAEKLSIGNRLGGHQVPGCGGYDVGDVPTIRPKACGPAILVQNSYGREWGLKGFFWAELPVMDLPTTDVKIFHSGHPW